MKINVKERLNSLVEELDSQIYEFERRFISLEKNNSLESLLDQSQDPLRDLHIDLKESVKAFLTKYKTLSRIKFPVGGNEKNLLARKLAKEIVDEYQLVNNKLPTGKELHKLLNKKIQEMALARIPCPNEIKERTCDLWLQEIREDRFSYEGEPTDF